MAKAKGSGWAPKETPKKTSIGNGKHTKYKSMGSSNTPPKGYRKKYRGQGRG
jgi:hypothetical protein